MRLFTIKSTPRKFTEILSPSCHSTTILTDEVISYVYDHFDFHELRQGLKLVGLNQSQ